MHFIVLCTSLRSDDAQRLGLALHESVQHFSPTLAAQIDVGHDGGDALLMAQGQRLLFRADLLDGPRAVRPRAMGLEIQAQSQVFADKQDAFFHVGHNPMESRRAAPSRQKTVTKPKVTHYRQDGGRSNISWPFPKLE